MATTTTTTTAPDGTTTTTTTSGPARRTEEWETPCYAARHARFKKSKIARDLRRFIRMAREVSDFGHDLVRRLPRAGVIDDFNLDDGETAANLLDSIQGGLWAFDIAFGLVSSELPFTTAADHTRRLAKRRKAKRKPAETAPSALPLFPVIDCRTPAEREADELAGKSWADVATEVALGIAEPLVPAGKPVNRIKNIA